MLPDISEKDWRNVQDLLCYLVAVDDENDGARRKQTSIAKALGKKVRSVKRYIALAVSLGVLESIRHGSLSNQYLIKNEQLNTLGISDGPQLPNVQATVAHRPGHCCHRPGHHCPSAGQLLPIAI